MSKTLILDTETTGFIEPIEPIEIAYLDIDYPSLIAKHSYCERLKPSKPIEYGAMATSHILESELIDCKPSSKYMYAKGEPLHLYLPEEFKVDYLIGHNIDYDWKVIGSPDVKRICTKALASYLVPDLDSYSQSALLYYFMEEEARPRLKEAHNALCDVYNCLLLLRFLLALADAADYSTKTIEDLHQLSEIARVPTKVTFGKFRGQPYTALDQGYVNWWLTKSDTPPDFYQKIALRKAGFRI